VFSGAADETEKPQLRRSVTDELRRYEMTTTTMTTVVRISRFVKISRFTDNIGSRGSDIRRR